MYNEEGNVIDTLSRVDNALSLLKEDYEIVVVDDGSTDSTAELAGKEAARNKRIRIACHKGNMGVGEALKTGFRESRGGVIVTIDADLSYSPEDIPKLLSKLDEADIVVGSPYMKDGNVEDVPYFRLMLSKVGNMMLAYSMSTHIHTVTSIFRAYRRVVVESLTLESAGPEIMPELIAKASTVGFKISEIPVVLKRRVRGKSKFKLRSGLEKHFMFSLYEKPASFIALFGLVFIILGLAIGVYLFTLYMRGSLDPERPLMTLMPLLLISGIQLLLFGVIAGQLAQAKKELYRIRARMRE